MFHLMAAFLLGLSLVDQVQSALHRRQPPRDRRRRLRQVLDRRDQHQHGRHERRETADGDAAGGALPERRADHRRQRRRRQQLRQRRHGRGRDGGLHRQPAQLAIEAVEALALRGLRLVQAHHAMGQHVFFDHIGQPVGGLLAGLGDPVQPPRQHFHHERHAGEDHQHDQRQLPVEVQQVRHQRHQRQRVLDQGQHGIHQQCGAGLHFVDHCVGERAGRGLAEHRHRRVEQPVEQLAAQRHHRLVGHEGERILRHETGGAANREQSHQHHRHDPQAERAALKAAVQQRLHQGRDHGLGHRRDQDRGDHAGQGPAGAAEIREKPRQPRPECPRRRRFVEAVGFVHAACSRGGVVTPSASSSASMKQK